MTQAVAGSGTTRHAKDTASCTCGTRSGSPMRRSAAVRVSGLSRWRPLGTLNGTHRRSTGPWLRPRASSRWWPPAPSWAARTSRRSLRRAHPDLRRVAAPGHTHPAVRREPSRCAGQRRAEAEPDAPIRLPRRERRRDRAGVHAHPLPRMHDPFINLECGRASPCATPLRTSRSGCSSLA